MEIDEYIRSIYDWYPIKHLVRIEKREEFDSLIDMGILPSYEYIAICAKEGYAKRLSETYEVLIPDLIIREMTDENGVIFTLDNTENDPWFWVAKCINEVALLCAMRRVLVRDSVSTSRDWI
jgi:hypothetical protein